MQMLINRCLLDLSTFTPAGSANEMAAITSDKPSMPRESLLLVISYNLHPSRTGLILSPAINKMRAITNQVNSLLIIMSDLFLPANSPFFIPCSLFIILTVVSNNAGLHDNLSPAHQ